LARVCALWKTPETGQDRGGALDEKPPALLDDMAAIILF
jgi:hypothetical protein